MLGFDRRIVLEDHLGVKHPVYLLETLDGHHFVLLPPEAADRLSALQAARGSIDDALAVLETTLLVMDVRSHRFLERDEAADVLLGSRHHVLVMLATRLGGDGEEAAPMRPVADANRTAEVSAHAFAEECRRRAAW